MACFANPDNYRLCETRTRNETPEKAAFQTDAHTGEMHTVPRENEPRSQPAQGDSGGMQCIPTKYLRGKSGLSRVQIALLAYVLDNPTKQGSRAVIADECGCAANSVPRAAKKLEELGLIERTPGGGKDATTYRIGRNLRADTRNIEVTSNTEVTATRNPDVSRNGEVTAEPETNAETQTRNTEVTATRNNPPLEPPSTNTNSTSPVDGGVGEGAGFKLEADEPRQRKSRRKPKRVATEASMPKTPSPAMLEKAAKEDFVNGSVQRMFDDWRNWHISKGTEIADYDASWRTWVDRRVDFRERDAAKAQTKPGMRFLGYGEDGKARYAKDQRTNVYRA